MRGAGKGLLAMGAPRSAVVGLRAYSKETRY
jgi:hypothetical protein